MTTITLLNQKGGVGKTSCTHHLSGTLATAFGKRVLVVDADPQASLTQGWWGPAVTRSLEPAVSIASVLAGDLPDPARVIHDTGVPGLSILPGSRASEIHNAPDPMSRGRDYLESLGEFLGEINGAFDLVLVDCPPNLYGCSFSALAASDHLIVPVQPEDYGAQGIADVLDSLATVRGAGYGVDILGFLLTMVSPRRSLHQVYEAKLRATYGEKVFTVPMPMSPDFPEAIAHRKPISLYKPKGAASKAVKAVAAELLARIEALSADHQVEGVAA